MRHTRYVGQCLATVLRELRLEGKSGHTTTSFSHVHHTCPRRAESLFQIQFKNAKNKLWEGARSLAETRKDIYQERELMLKGMEAGQNKKYVPLRISGRDDTWASCPKWSFSFSFTYYLKFLLTFQFSKLEMGFNGFLTLLKLRA